MRLLFWVLISILWPFSHLYTLDPHLKGPRKLNRKALKLQSATQCMTVGSLWEFQDTFEENEIVHNLPLRLDHRCDFVRSLWTPLASPGKGPWSPSLRTKAAINSPVTGSATCRCKTMKPITSSTLKPRRKATRIRAGVAGPKGQQAEETTNGALGC